MFGINELLNKFVSREELTELENLKILRSKVVNIKVLEYLRSKLDNLYIDISRYYKGFLFELMQVGKLEGWCFETTESAIVFLNDDDYIERGNIKLGERKPKYYHSWICFKFDGIEYVLDPCLNILCKKIDYSKIFEAKVKGKVNAKEVSEELIRQITTPKEKKNSDSHRIFESITKSIMGLDYDSYMESIKEEVTVYGSGDVNAPLYMNSSRYKAEIDNGKVKKLTVHYYMYY